VEGAKMEDLGPIDLIEIDKIIATYTGNALREKLLSSGYSIVRIDDLKDDHDGVDAERLEKLEKIIKEIIGLTDGLTQYT
jgi:hypothetical protein